MKYLIRMRVPLDVHICYFYIPRILCTRHVFEVIEIPGTFSLLSLFISIFSTIDFHGDLQSVNSIYILNVWARETIGISMTVIRESFCYT